MGERYSSMKRGKIDDEQQFINVEWVESLATTILDEINQWANNAIYNKLGGNLTYSVPLKESANAGAIVNPKDPYNPKIVIHLGMIIEIYRDALVYPLVTNKISSDTNPLKYLNESFGNEYFCFEGGIPEISYEKTTELFKLFKDDLVDKFSHPLFSANNLAARFLMFELQLAWTFFHELAHLVQRHYLFKVTHEDMLSDIELFEIRNDKYNTDECAKFQAREILADIEGFGLTVRYMLSKKIFNYQAVYLLFCSSYCMFNRFFESYADSLDFVSSTHPHPVIRNDLSQIFVIELISHILVRMKQATKDECTIPLVYMATRASLMSGLYWANRYENFDGSTLSMFMNLSTQDYEDERKQYIEILKKSMLEQIEVIKVNHLMEDNFIDFILSCHSMKNE